MAEKKSKKEEIDYKELAQRTQANFENYRKQVEKRITEMREFATKNIIMELLPILDNFELALKNQGEGFKEGIELIYAELSKILDNNDVQAIETENKQFDPYQHEALIKEVSDKPENTILDELQKGYTLHDKVIRAARVKISAGKEINTNKEE